MIDDEPQAPLNLIEEGKPQSRTLKLVVPRGLAQFALREPVKLGSSHSLQLGPGVTKDVRRRGSGFSRCVPVGVPPIRLLSPPTFILLVRESL
jgi:hypothetical protein